MQRQIQIKIRENYKNELVNFLTSCKVGVILYLNKNKIEVAFFMSKALDVSGTDEDAGKEKMPKGYDA